MNQRLTISNAAIISAPAFALLLATAHYGSVVLVVAFGVAFALATVLTALRLLVFTLPRKR